MLPLVYRNLRSAGLDESELTLLRGVYRQFWLKMRLTLRSASQALTVLRAAGVEPVSLKGLGLIATAYPEATVRPMHDLDFLFRGGEFTRAFDALLAHGWLPVRGTRASYARRLKVFHALPLIGPDGTEVDLHRYMLEENCFPGADTAVFERLKTGQAGDVPVTTPGPEDQVINACVHGVRWDPLPPLRWVIDAVMVIRAAGDGFDWEYLAQEARRREVTVGMSAALAFASRFEPSIPQATVDQLASERAGRLERWDFRFQQGGNSVVSQIGRYVTRYLRLSAHRSPLRKARDFPTYLECMWELESPRQVPAESIRRVWRRVRA